MSGAGRLVYRGLTALQLPKLRRAVSRRATVFTFHGVVADAHVGRGERSLHIGETAFARYVEWISANYAVVPLGELVDRARRGGPLRGLAALTFDDAYVGVFRHAVPVLRRFALPATVFAIEGASARPAPLWWDVLGDADERVREARRGREQQQARQPRERPTRSVITGISAGAFQRSGSMLTPTPRPT